MKKNLAKPVLILFLTLSLFVFMFHTHFSSTSVSTAAIPRKIDPQNVPQATACRELFKMVLKLKANVHWPPPETVPSELYAAYTMNGKIPIVDYYVAERQNQAPEPYQWTENLVSVLMNEARNKLPMGYGHESFSLYRALEAFPVENMNGIVLGSQTPWAEAMSLANGNFKPALLYY
jgi:hypothetical protein